MAPAVQREDHAQLILGLVEPGLKLDGQSELARRSGEVVVIRHQGAPELMGAGDGWVGFDRRLRVFLGFGHFPERGEQHGRNRSGRARTRA